MMSGSKEYSEDKKKYIFFTDPDVIAQRAEDTAATLHHHYSHPKDVHQDDHQIPGYPFTFISAVKRKLALAAQNDSCKRIYSPELTKPLDTIFKPLDPEDMEFVKPLKVPDLKICPKSLDYSPRKFPNTPKDSPKQEKTSKLSLAHRKLDFSGSESTSFIGNDEIESIKAPDISFTSTLSKKKDYTRDSSREKENRSKKFRKDDSSFSKSEDSPDMTKRRNLRHISRKDLETLVQKSKNERFSLTAPREDLSELINPRKSQKKILPTSTKKDSRSTSSYSGKSRERSLESRSRTFSSESMLDRNLKPRESSRGSGSESSIQKYNEETKHRTPSSKEIHKKLLEKVKRSVPKSHHRQISTTSELSEDLEIENGGKFKRKTKDNERIGEQKTSERPSTDSPNELFLDPRRISFRDDSYSQQDEFVNLVTPDLNFSRLKYRKEPKLQQNSVDKEVEVENFGLKKNSDDERENTNLLHPTALHMQFQAELHLFDSYNESLRQVMDVENSLYNVKQDKEREGIRKALAVGEMLQEEGEDVNRNCEVEDKLNERMEIEGKRVAKEADYKLVSAAANAGCNAKEVQTQTVNDIATQTERSKFPGITYSRGSLCDLGQLSLNSIDEFDDLERLEEISLPSKIRTMSEISLHETTSSIKTETGTEISISTRDVTCSFNKYLDHEMAQLIKDEKLMYDKIEMLFKSREKTLNDRTRKLVKLEEQKRALRDTGQDSRISSVKKKQRALLLKLQQEKDEMNRLKELHKLASQERKLMLQKQRNMFNPHLSTKNILTKLKRSADCQSPRRLSGPMKGYDIRSNSSVSSLVDSDKSQLDRSRQNFNKSDGQKPSKLLQDSSNSSQLDCAPKKYELKARKFEEKMPKCGDLLKLKSHQLEIDSKLLGKGSSNIVSIVNDDEKTESDTLVEDFAKKNCGTSELEGKGFIRRGKVGQVTDDKCLRKISGTSDLKSISKKKGVKTIKGKSSATLPVENFKGRSDFSGFDNDLAKYSKKSKVEKDSSTDGNGQNSIIGALDLDDSQNSLQALLKHSKAVKEKNHKLLKDIADEDEAQAMNNIANEREFSEKAQKNEHEEVQGIGNISTRSHVSTFTISRHSSGDSEKSYSRSVVIRSQDSRFKAPKKLAQILNAREEALATRRNCVDDWIAWHARLKSEESRVARMEEAAYKLVSATTNALSNDTILSSDTSDVEGRVELLAEKLTEKRAEMAKLRREARRQAKQRLKALEANLLNQIKKYDTTIHEMRTKLDSKRGISKENGKLAIEAKHVADFKVPEMSIKRIQEIYRNSDLLHSRSESDLITGTKPYTDSSNNQERVPLKPLSRSIESVLEDAKNHSSRRSATIISSALSDSRVTSSEERISEILDVKSQEEVNSDISTEITQRKSLSDTSDEIKTTSDESIFSRKMDFLQLNNQNLNEDISTLENDLKTLSEMMSKFSKKSDEKIRSANTLSENTIGRNTSRDISEDLTKSENIEVELESNIPEIPSKITKLSATIPDEKSIKSPDQMDFEARSKEILDEIEKSVITENSKNSGNNLELSGAALERSMETLHKENEALSSDFTSLEGDIKSISEIISKMNENRNSLSPHITPQVESAVSASEDSENVEEASIPVESENIENSKFSKSISKFEETLTEVDGTHEDGNDSSLTSEKSLERTDASGKDEFSLDKSDWTISDSFEVPKVSLLDTELADENDDDQEEEEIQEEMTLVEDSVFLPRGESTTIDGKILRPDATIDETSNRQGIQTDELDDILDIIERDTQASEMGYSVHLHVPEELNLEIKDDSIPPADHVLNLTADVEPVLQKLTEILISVEKNIARRTEGKSIHSSSDDNNKDEKTDKLVDESIDFNDENLVETDIDEKIEINEHLDEALNKLTLEEEQNVSIPSSKVSENQEEKFTQVISKIPEVIKDPEYEDISEESLEVSDIFDRSESHRSQKSSNKSNKIPTNYQIMEKTDNVLIILDEISRKTAKDKEISSHLHKVDINVEVFGDISPGVVIEEIETSKNHEKSLDNEKSKNKTMIEEPEDSSDAGDTPKEISEIDLDSPREQNESRLDIEALDDDLLGSNCVEKDSETEFFEISTSEKDIEMMIDKLRASLDQPNLPVAELDARLLRIEQLQIELEIEKIKKLEAEEVSLYVREIPNKPPPPYTPPGVVRLPSPQISPTLPPAVIPTNVEELTAFTEKATALIYNSKFTEDEIMCLEAPLEILESNKDSNEISKKDRKIYNTFLFDLCKETIAEIYQLEYEKPGPSWTKPSVKTKPAIKIPKNLEELTDYVNKEVATLFGFKTKLQRENMVMRWSRKRRDRVDELLAREAQAEEDEWTKFHHDELAVKNELTIAILDTLVLETTSVVKAAFTKKQNIFV